MRLSVILLLLQLWGNVEMSSSQNACSKLPDVPHAQVSDQQQQYQEGDLIQFTCKPGYTASVPAMKYLCMREGWRAVRQGTCYYITCEAGVMLPHLIVAGLPPANETMKIGHKLQFSCDDQYTMEGSAESECVQTGQWSAAFPTCAENCKVTGVSGSVLLIERVRVNQLRKGEKLTFQCRRRGDFLQGKAVVTCLADGQWSDPFPTCGAPLGCGKPPSLLDGDIKTSLQFQYRHNDRVEYICENFYTMEGQPYKTCINGEWTGQMRCLKPCTVDRDAMNVHNIAFRFIYDDKLYSAHNDEIEFMCTRRRTLVGRYGLRQKCVDGVMHLPTCQ
uniref:complement factor H-like isoform X2 n=1 Tax=Epinephelus lanceolatus TaxID=310571 RepID=UPI001444F463|nr:complement factor H-like isoform X2 [Epinephelus lanceolatus]